MFARDGARYKENGVEDCAVEAEDVTGDHGREEAIELRDRLRLYIVGIGGISSVDVRGRPETEGLRGDCCLTVAARSSTSTFVELFHAGRDLSVAFVSALRDGDESGVRL